MCSELRQIVTKAALNKTLPMIRYGRVKYGVSLDAMDLSPRSEIETLLTWKTNAFLPGRPAKARVRAISAKHLQSYLCRMVGYVQQYYGPSPRNLAPGAGNS